VRREIKRGEGDELDGLLTSSGDGRELPSFGEERPVVELVQSWPWCNTERKGDEDSIRERQNGKETTRRTQWCAHLRPKMNDDDERARRSCGGVAGVRVDDGVDVGFV
jgi:hypothetical protein